jgi:peptide/nickel transport system substrate-binding protein
VEASSDMDILELPGTNSYYLILNYENPALQDLRVRQAINCAINRESIVNNLLDGHGIPATGLLPDTNPYVTPENNLGYGYDPEKAKSLLAAAGYADSDGDGILEKGGQPLALDFVFQNAEYPDWKPLCEYLETQLRAVGIRADLKMMDVTAYYDAIWTSRNYGLVIYRTYADSWNPHGFLAGVFYQSEKGKSVCWNDDQLDRLLDSALTSVDEAERQDLYDQYFRRMYEEAVCVPLYYPQSLYVYNKRLVNLEPAATSYEIIKWEKLDVQ